MYGWPTRRLARGTRKSWAAVAVAQLGLTFWNRPMLSEAFLAELSAVLGGHRLVAARTSL
jgi:hypothetical protein